MNSNKKNRIPSSLSEKLAVIISYVILAAIFIVCVFPFWFILINAFSSPSAVKEGEVLIYPLSVSTAGGFSFGIVSDNISAVFSDKSFTGSLLITAVRTVIGTLVTTAVSVWGGFLLSKKTLWQSRLWNKVVVLFLFFGAGMLPWYLTMDMLGLSGSFWGYILPFAASPLGIILVRAAVSSVPSSFEESASLDGASFIRVFFRLILPMCAPAIGAFALFCAVQNWNSFMDSLLLMKNAPGLRSLQHTLFNIMNDNFSAGSYQNAAASPAFGYAAVLISLLPLLIAFPFMSRNFEKYNLISGIKS